jgi:hypothetical protein
MRREVGLPAVDRAPGSSAEEVFEAESRARERRQDGPTRTGANAGGPAQGPERGEEQTDHDASSEDAPLSLRLMGGSSLTSGAGA